MYSMTITVWMTCTYPWIFCAVGLDLNSLSYLLPIHHNSLTRLWNLWCHWHRHCQVLRELTLWWWRKRPRPPTSKLIKYREGMKPNNLIIFYPINQTKSWTYGGDLHHQQRRAWLVETLHISLTLTTFHAKITSRYMLVVVEHDSYCVTLGHCHHLR